MIHTVANLSGVLLDAAAAKAGEVEIEYSLGQCRRKPIPGVAFETYQPSRDWRDGGPIIERERIVLEPDEPKGGGGGWTAFLMEEYGHEGAVAVPGTYHAGPTPLVAAMRAYVASKFGNEVELP